jgi:ferredoxin
VAIKSAKFSHNISGKYYVDEQCIACDACVMAASGFFIMNDSDGHAYVKNQPQTADEIAECENALAACPVEAIGNDGNY